MVRNYDVIIIGSGQAGNPLAKKFAAAGKKTALIEKAAVGGTCINYGCTPTKTMVASAKLAHQARNSEELGVAIKGVEVDMADIIARKDDVVSLMREGSKKGLEKTEGLDLIFGEAYFIGEKQIEVKDEKNKAQQFYADLIFIDTGTQPIVLPIEGLDSVDYFTSKSLLEQTEKPEHLLIIGGNYIGLEFGQMFKRFGSKVTIVEKGDRLLKREDKEISSTLTGILEEEGIDILTHAEVTQVTKTAKHKIHATVKQKSSKKEITCSHLLIAVGREPTSKALHLDKTGVEVDDKGFIKTNDKLETNVKGIYALGDIKGGPAFTHIAYNDFTIVFRNILEGQSLTIKDRDVPYCMFTDPQLGRIGITEQEAKEKKINYKVASLTMDKIGRAIETAETKGVMRVIVDVDSKKILGAAILGAQGGEIMSILQMAMAGGITYDKLRYFIFAHPTYAEAINNLFVQLD